MTTLDSIFKSRDITLPTKVCPVKAMVFPVVMYGCESWTVKKAECWRIDAFELWCWRRLLRVPWTARRSNQSILKEISPGCSLEGLMLKLKLQYFGHLIQRVDSLERLWCWEGLGARGEWTTEDEMAGWHHQLDGHEWVNSRSWWWTGRPGVLRFMGLQSRTRLSDWTELNWLNSQHDSIWRWGLWEVIGFRWNHEGGVLIVGLEPLEEKTVLSLSSIWGCNKNKAICKPGGGFSPGSDQADTQIADFSASRIAREQRLLFKPVL